LLDSLRSQCLREPQRFKFARSEVMAEEEAARAQETETFSYMESNSEQYRGRHDKKDRCYSMVVGSKEVSEEVKSIATAVEEGVNMMKTESGGMQVKAVYKRYTFDFIKPDGYIDGINLSLPKPGKKQSSSKLTINSFLVCLGDSVKLEYTIDEDANSYKFSVTLSSGDAFAVNSQVQGLRYTVKEVLKGTKPKDMVLREGAMLVTVERE
jgi:hypothetical protein